MSSNVGTESTQPHNSAYAADYGAVLEALALALESTAALSGAVTNISRGVVVWTRTKTPTGHHLNDESALFRIA